MDIKYLLIDIQTGEIITAETISPLEAELRNTVARAVGENYLQWQPIRLLKIASI